jgi:putative hemolysin
MRVRARAPVVLVAFAVTVVLCGCSGAATQPQEAASVALPNPASANCAEQGGRLEMTEDPDGNQRGTCVFPDGSRCDEWALFRSECAPGDEPP